MPTVIKDSPKVASMFAITAKDGLKVVDSSTVICLRRVPPSDGGAVLSTSQFPQRYISGLLGGRDEVSFECGWEVLMGQSEVKNWMRSSRDETVTMRYAGEYKFAGGEVDPGEGILHCGARELAEEFLEPAGLALPADAAIRPFCVKQTMPVRSKSHLM
jgi:hypothetical protein